MKFMLQVRFNGADAVIGELPAEEQQKVTDEFIALRKSDGVLDGDQLLAASEAATVRVKAGRRGSPPAPPSTREPRSTATTSTTRQTSTPRSPSRSESRPPGSARPSRSAR